MIKPCSPERAEELKLFCLLALPNAEIVMQQLDLKKFRECTPDQAKELILYAKFLYPNHNDGTAFLYVTNLGFLVFKDVQGNWTYRHDLLGTICDNP